MLPWGGYLPGLALANSHGWGREAFLVSLRIAQGAVMWITYANLGIGIVCGSPGRSCTVSNDAAGSELKPHDRGSFVVGPLAQGLRSMAGRTAEPQEGNLIKRQPILTTFDYPS